MKVKELIEELKKLDQDREIYYLAIDYNGDAYPVIPDEIITLREYLKIQGEECVYFSDIGKESYII